MPEPRSDTAPGLAALLRAGALYDWLLGAVILAAHPAVFRLFRTPPPDDLHLFRMNALTLALLGLFYWRAAGEPRVRRWAAGVAVLLRVVGGTILILLTLAHRPPGAGTYIAFGLVDYLWGAVLAVALRRA
jgi:hypothetical protein